MCLSTPLISPLLAKSGAKSYKGRCEHDVWPASLSGGHQRCALRLGSSSWELFSHPVNRRRGYYPGLAELAATEYHPGSEVRTMIG